MDKKEYIKKLNLNTVICHGIISIVLCVAYVVEFLIDNRDSQYVASFLLITFIPWLIVLKEYKQCPESETLKYTFSIGYCVFYSFSVITSRTPVNFVYIIPMSCVLMSYCSLKLIAGVFGYALFINIVSISLRYFGVLKQISIETSLLTTINEISLFAIFLSGIFLFRTTNLVKSRDVLVNELANEAYIDALTKCKNIRFLNEKMGKSLRYGDCKNLSVIFIDVDDFKHFNTEYGHSFGDKVLQDLAKTIKACISEIPHTYAVRVGGDEFIIISRTMTDEIALAVAEDIRRGVEDLIVTFDNKQSSVKISIGIATKSSDKSCKTTKHLYDLADSRNQKAKLSGKNQVKFQS